MGCDLEQVFSELAARVPDGPDACFTFSADVMPQVPESITTERLVIEKTYHAYDDDFRCDSLHFYATKSTYCEIALLVLSVLFSRDTKEVVLRLSHPASSIRHLIVRRASREGAPGLYLQPIALNYYPSTVEKHPWPCFNGNPYELPGFFLTNTNESVVSEKDWQDRDTVVGFGSDVAMARFAELLLDATRPSSHVSEFDLEGEGGFRGVARHSCEARLILPGSFAWDARVPVGVVAPPTNNA